MIFVNYGSGGYAQFEHGPWHGITFADIVFPLFVWMLGTSLVISLKNASDRNTCKRSLLKKTLTRTLKLFVRSKVGSHDGEISILLFRPLDLF